MFFKCFLISLTKLLVIQGFAFVLTMTFLKGKWAFKIIVICNVEIIMIIIIIIRRRRRKRRRITTTTPIIVKIIIMMIIIIIIIIIIGYNYSLKLIIYLKCLIWQYHCTYVSILLFVLVRQQNIFFVKLKHHDRYDQVDRNDHDVLILQALCSVLINKWALFIKTFT